MSERPLDQEQSAPEVVMLHLESGEVEYVRADEVARLQKENEELRVDLSCAEKAADGLRDIIAGLIVEGERAEARVKALTEGLRKCGVHSEDCDYWHDSDFIACDCGLSALLAEDTAPKPTLTAAFDFWKNPAENVYEVSPRRNRARCRKCGDVIESMHGHDMRYCSCKAIAVDGGQDYHRRVGNPEDIEEMPASDAGREGRDVR